MFKSIKKFFKTLFSREPELATLVAAERTTHTEQALHQGPYPFTSDHYRMAQEMAERAARARADVNEQLQAYRDDIARLQEAQRVYRVEPTPVRYATVDQGLHIFDTHRYYGLYTDELEPKPVVKKVKRNLPDWW